MKHNKIWKQVLWYSAPPCTHTHRVMSTYRKSLPWRPVEEGTEITSSCLLCVTT